MADNKPVQRIRKGQGKYGRYRDRYNAGNTVKGRRILRNLLKGMTQPGWKLRENKQGIFRG